MSQIPDWFPEALFPALQYDLGPAEAALANAPELETFWNDLAGHVAKMVAQGWDSITAAGTLAGAVLLPLAMGHDAHGTLSRKIRDGVNMPRRKKAAKLARELSALLNEIEREPMPPDAVISVASLLPKQLIARDAPSYFLCKRTTDLLNRLANSLEVPPDYSDVPGLASQKPSWRGFIREVKAGLSDSGFTLRERDAVKMVGIICRVGRTPIPTREDVHHALRWEDLRDDSEGKSPLDQNDDDL